MSLPNWLGYPIHTIKLYKSLELLVIHIISCLYLNTSATTTGCWLGRGELLIRWHSGAGLRGSAWLAMQTLLLWMASVSLPPSSSAPSLACAPTHHTKPQPYRKNRQTIAITIVCGKGERPEIVSLKISHPTSLELSTPKFNLTIAAQTSACDITWLLYNFHCCMNLTELMWRHTAGRA